MNTAVTQCRRCSGERGAHFAFCFLAQAWERLMGPGFPWAPPTAPAVEEIPLPPEPPEDVPYEPDWDWMEEIAYLDPPDKEGVYEDFLVLAGHMESDANWLPHGLKSIEVAKTDLPEGYLEDLIDDLLNEQPPPQRTYNISGLVEHKRQEAQAREDAAVQFVYDVCDFVAGGRVLLNELAARYVEWAAANGRPSMSRDTFRDLLKQLGMTIEPGRLPGERTSGRPPLLVHGVQLRQQEEKPEPSKVVVSFQEAKAKPREKHALIGAKPGRELPKQVRELIEPLITEQGWSYEPTNGNGRGKPRLVKGNKTVTLPTTPHLQGRTLENTRSHLKANGAVL